MFQKWGEEQKKTLTIYDNIIVVFLKQKMRMMTN